MLESAFNKTAPTHMIFNHTGGEMVGYLFNDASCSEASLVTSFGIHCAHQTCLESHRHVCGVHAAELLWLTYNAITDLFVCGTGAAMGEQVSIKGR